MQYERAQLRCGENCDRNSLGCHRLCSASTVCVGCGAFGHGMGGMLSRKALKGSPDLQKQLEIEQKDERNIAISNSAKGKAFDIMLFVYGALMLSFALMQVDLAAILLFVFCYLLVLGCSIYYRVKYEKEM